MHSGRVVSDGYGGYVGLSSMGWGYYRSLRASDASIAYYLSVGVEVNTADDYHSYGGTSRSAGFPLRCLAS